MINYIIKTDALKIFNDVEVPGKVMIIKRGCLKS